MTGRTQQVFLHVAGCMIFLALPFLFSPESLSLHSYLTNPPTQRDIIAYVLLLGVFYTNYYLLIPRFYFLRKYIPFIGCNLLCFALLLSLPALLRPRGQDSIQADRNTYPPRFQSSPADTSRPHRPPPNASGSRQPPPDASGSHRPPPDASGPPDSPPPSNSASPASAPRFPAGPADAPPDSPSPSDSASPAGPANAGPTGSSAPPADFHRPPPGSRPPFRVLNGEHFFIFLVVLFLALLLKIRDRWIRAEEEKLHAELSYLKAQINPHFLFNILNSIYAMALGRSDQTAGAIVRLSSMMRYVLVEAGRDKVSLEQEITYLTDYIQLQQTRFEGSLQLSLEVNGRTENRQIVPLLLIPFVENAFKYGVNPEEPSAIGIRIDIGEQEFQLHVSNKKVAIHHPAATQGGLGIKNTRQRLQMLYPGKHTLIIEDSSDSFTVSLTLKGI